MQMEPHRIASNSIASRSQTAPNLCNQNQPKWMPSNEIASLDLDWDLGLGLGLESDDVSSGGRRSQPSRRRQQPKT